jgi:hypothetical protein
LYESYVLREGNEGQHHSIQFARRRKSLTVEINRAG